MRRPISQKSATMVSASDLTIVAPICKGLVPALDAVTYKTRAMRVLRALHQGRGAALRNTPDIDRPMPALPEHADDTEFGPVARVDFSGTWKVVTTDRRRS